jgi:hypothetical protein
MIKNRHLEQTWADTLRRSIWCLALIALFASVNSLADTIVLKDGQVFTGTFKGGTEGIINFEVDGSLRAFAIGDITTMTFSPRTQTGTTAPPTAPTGSSDAKVSTPVSGTFTLPAGTRLFTKFDGEVSTATHGAGSKFTAVTEMDITVGGAVVVPKGTTIYGKVVQARGGKRLGKVYLIMEYSDFSLNNQLFPIVTDQFGAEGGGGQAIRAAGAGALIGAGVGDDKGDGAARGAMIGAGLSLMGPKNHIAIPAGTLVEVNLKQPATIQR